MMILTPSTRNRMKPSLRVNTAKLRATADRGDSREMRLRALAIKAYWAATTPTEAKMAGILMDLFAPDISPMAQS